MTDVVRISPPPERAPSRVLDWLMWLGALVFVTAALRAIRSEMEQAHVTLVYLLLVLGASARGGRAIGLTIATCAIAAIDFFFQSPFDTIVVHKNLDWLVLATFYLTAIVATSLVTRARREGAAASKLKELVLVSASHDLRTPLTTIKALAQGSTLAGTPTGRAIEEQVDRLTRLVTDVLDFSRLERTDPPLDIAVNTAEDLIGGVVRQTKGVLDGRRLDVQLTLEPEALAGRFDYVSSLRILTNLIENAARYTAANDAVLLTVDGRGHWLELRVGDRGPGVVPAEREAIFEPFYRAPSAPVDAGRVGLGLAIARRLAVAQGGTLVYHPRDGGGSVFTLRLPRAEVPAMKDVYVPELQRELV